MCRPGTTRIPYNPTKAKQMLAAAGYKNGLNLTLLYRPSSTVESKMAQTLQSDLTKIGVKVKLLSATPSDFYVKYMEVPSVAKRGVWDLSLAGWGPDWYGDAAVSFFNPLFSGPASYPPQGSNFGFYNNQSVTALIAKGASAASASCGRDHLGPGGPGGHEGRAVLPDRQPEPAAVPRQLCAQCGVHPGDPAVRPDECVAQHAVMIPDAYDL